MAIGDLKNWFNGLPAPGLKSSAGALKNWFNGLPVQNLATATPILLPTLVTDTDTFFAPSINGANSVTPSFYTDTDTFFAPTVSVGAITLIPGLFSDTDTFFAPTITLTNQVLLASLVTDTDTFFAPTIAAGAVTLTASLFIDTDTVYSPTASAGAVTLTAGLYTDNDTFYAPTLTVGSVTLTASLYIDTDTFYAPTVTTSAVTIVPSLFASDDTFYAPTVTAGSVTLTASLFTDTDTFYAPSTGGLASLAPSLIVDTDTFYAPSVLAGSITLLPSRFVDTDTIYALTLPNSNTLQPSLYTDVDVFYVPSATYRYGLTPSRYTDTDTFYAPTISTTSLNLEPFRVIDLDIFYTPTVQRVASQGGGGGGNNSIPANVKYATQFTMATAGLITALQIEVTNLSVSAHTRMMLYADSAGVPRALLAKSNDRTGLAVGTVNYALITPHSVLAGEKVWVAIHTDAAIQVLGNTPSGSRYNTDTFSDGPSDPFGVTSLDNKKAPVLLVILEAVNASMQPPLYHDELNDVFYAPSLGKTYTLFPPHEVDIDDLDFFYSPLVRGNVSVSPNLITDSETFYVPAVTPGAVTLLPSFVTEDDAVIIPVIGIQSFPTQLFPPLIAADDTFGDPTGEASKVTSLGADLPPLLFIDNDVFLVPDVLSISEILPTLVDDTEDLDSPQGSSVAGSVTLSPLLWIDTDQHWPSLLTQASGLHSVLPDLTTDNDVIYRPSLNRSRHVHNIFISGTRAQTGITLIGNANDVQVELEGDDA